MRWLPAVLIGGIAFGLPARALACECSLPIFTLPANGATGVPLNTAIWLPSFVTETPTLTVFGATDAVPITCVSLGHTMRCVPAAELLPSTRYVVEATTVDFTTGTERDDAGPAPPAEVERRYYSSNGSWASSSSCSSSEPGGVVVLTLNGGEPILVVDATGGTDPGAPSAPVTELLVVDGQPRSNEAWIGSWSCVGNRPAEPGDRFPLRVGALDMAGNFSGWVVLEDAAIPPTVPGCAASTSDGGLATLILVAASIRRQRVRRVGPT